MSHSKICLLYKGTNTVNQNFNHLQVIQNQIVHSATGNTADTMLSMVDK